MAGPESVILVVIDGGSDWQNTEEMVRTRWPVSEGAHGFMVCCLEFAAPTTTIEQQQQNSYSHLPPRYIGRPWISFFHCASHEMSLIVKDFFTQIPELA